MILDQCNIQLLRKNRFALIARILTSLEKSLTFVLREIEDSYGSRGAEVLSSDLIQSFLGKRSLFIPFSSK